MRLLRKKLCSLLLCAFLVAGLLPMSGIGAAQAEGATHGTLTVQAKGATYDTLEARGAAINKLRYRFLGEMLSHIGCAYEKGKGHFPTAQTFDCSGLIAHAFISIGYSRYFSISEKKWDPGKFQAYDGSGIPSSDWKDFSWRGSRGLLENVRDGQTIYLIPDSSKNPVLAFTVRKSDKGTDFVSDISNPSKWPDAFRDSVKQRGNIIVKNHVSQTKWHTTVVAGYYDEAWFRSNGHELNPARTSISSVKKIIRKDLVSEFSAYGLSSSVLSKVHRGLADGTFAGEKIGGKTVNSEFNDLDREDDVYPAMWDLRQRRITNESVYSPLWQIDALNPRLGVSVNNSTLAASQDSSVAMVLEWEEFGSCSLTDCDNGSDFGGENAPIAGAVYSIYNKDGSYETLAERTPLATATAGSDGVIRFSGLPVDTMKHRTEYYVAEISPPPGCLPNRTVHAVTVTANNDAEIVEGGIVISRLITGSLTVLLDKSDCLADAEAWCEAIATAGAVSGSASERTDVTTVSMTTAASSPAVIVYPVGHYALSSENVRTAITYSENSPLHDLLMEFEIRADGDIICNGQTLYADDSVVCIISGDAGGTASAVGLPPGDYLIFLRKAPRGWSKNFPLGGTRVSVTLSEEMTYATRTLACSKLKLRPVIRVVDTEEALVAGGRFALYCENDIYDYTGQKLLIARDTPIAVGTADADGILRFGYDASADTFTDLLPAGPVYYIAELASPEGVLPADGRLVEFPYSAAAWTSKDTATQNFTITLEKIPVEPEVIDPVPERSLPEPTPTDVPAAQQASAGTPARTLVSALPLIVLLLLLGGITAVLWRIRGREEGK